MNHRDADAPGDRQRPEFHRERVTVRVRWPVLARWFGRLARCALLVMTAAIVVLLVIPRPKGLLQEVLAVSLGAGLLGAPALGLLVLFWRAVRWKAVVRALHLTSGELVLQGARWRRQIRRDAIKDGLLVPGEPGRVDLGLKDGSTVQLTLKDHGAAQELLRAAGMDPARHRVTLEVGRLLGKLGWGFAAFCGCSIVLTFLPMLTARWLSLEPGGLIVLCMPLSALATWAAVVHLGERWISVGTDGVETWHGWRRRFFPLAELKDVEASPTGLRLTLNSGETVSLNMYGARAYSLASRIQQVRGFAGELPEAAPMLRMLDRAGRDVARWRTDLAALAGEDPGYRRQSLDPAHLERALADPLISPEQRMAAAIVLLAMEAPGASDRVLAAAKTCAQSPLRNALEKLARGEADDEQLRVALVLK